MNTRTILIILLAVLVLLGIFALVRSNTSENTAQAEPLTFEECAARYPVQETYPRRCVSESGKIFVENVATPPAPAPSTPNTPAQPATSGIPNLITVTSPTSGQKVTSPLTISGQARGGWYFEATFPVEIRNAAGTVIAQHYAEAQSDWMTENYVPFRATLSFPQQPSGSQGTVILRKSNASGDPARDQSVSIPVVF
jgi:hypothetical protein